MDLFNNHKAQKWVASTEWQARKRARLELSQQKKHYITTNNPNYPSLPFPPITESIDVTSSTNLNTESIDVISSTNLNTLITDKHTQHFSQDTEVGNDIDSAHSLPIVVSETSSPIVPEVGSWTTEAQSSLEKVRLNVESRCYWGCIINARSDKIFIDFSQVIPPSRSEVQHTGKLKVANLLSVSEAPQPYLELTDNKKLLGMTVTQAIECGLEPVVCGSITIWITTKSIPLMLQNSKGEFKKLFPLDKEGNTIVYLYNCIVWVLLNSCLTIIDSLTPKEYWWVLNVLNVDYSIMMESTRLV